MTEKEKMLAGSLYQAFEPSLYEDRQHAKELLYRYNRLSPICIEERDKLIKELFGTTKKNIFVEQPFQCDYGYNIHVGENFYANVNCVILDGAPVTIGDDVLLAPNVSLCTAGHPENISQRRAGYEYAYPINIGDNVWLGAGVVVVSGVTIGDNTIIGAGSVVTKDIPANVIAVGNPCRVLRSIREEDRI